MLALAGPLSASLSCRSQAAKPWARLLQDSAVRFGPF